MQPDLAILEGKERHAKEAQHHLFHSEWRDPTVHPRQSNRCKDESGLKNIINGTSYHNVKTRIILFLPVFTPLVVPKVMGTVEM